MPPYDALERLARQAARLGPADAAEGLPPLLALSDPQRTPNPRAAMAALPAGCGYIYRHFGAADRFTVAAELSAMARQRGLVFLVSADAQLEAAIAPDGVHWPERWLSMAARRRARGDRRLFTGAAHCPAALARAEQADLDAALYSPVFASVSPSAGRTKGHFAAAAAARYAGLPVYALGGITPRTAARLPGLGFSGLACVGALAPERAEPG